MRNTRTHRQTDRERSVEQCIGVEYVTQTCNGIALEITTIAHILNCLCIFALKCNYSMERNIWIVAAAAATRTVALERIPHH